MTHNVKKTSNPPVTLIKTWQYCFEELFEAVKITCRIWVRQSVSSRLSDQQSEKPDSLWFLVMIFVMISPCYGALEVLLLLACYVAGEWELHGHSGTRHCQLTASPGECRAWSGCYEHRPWAAGLHHWPRTRRHGQVCQLDRRGQESRHAPSEPGQPDSPGTGERYDVKR